MKRIISILFSLIIVLILITYFNNKYWNNPDELIIKFGEISKSISSLSDYETTSITTKKGDNYIALSVMTIVNSLDIKEEEITKITFHSSDGGSMLVRGSELKKLYLIENKENNKKYYRLIIPNEDFSQRWLKYITKIVLSND